MSFDQNDELHSGYNDLKQVEMSVLTAQKVVGNATMSLDPEQMDDARDVINNAKTMLNEARQSATGVDEGFLQNQEKILAECEHQFNEAQQLD